MKIFIEYGLDFDNNRFGFGKSVEVENDDGTEYRTKQTVKLKNKSYYARVWIGKIVFALSQTKGLNITHKKRYNFKIVFGVQGEKND